MKSLGRVLMAIALAAFLSTAAIAQEDSASYPPPDSNASYPDASNAPAPDESASYPDQDQGQPSASANQPNGYPAPAENDNTPDPPGRVARLQYMTGAVSIQPKGTEEWVAGSLNRPLTTTDNVWTDKDARAELNVGTGLLRLNSETSLTLTNVSDNTVQVSLHQGTLNVRIRHLYDGEIYEIDTPNMAFTIQKAGFYRFDVDPNGDASIVTVWKGAGDATGSGPSVRVKAGERMRFTDGTSMAHIRSEAPPLDGFDDWCRVRDRRLDNSISARYVSPDVIGYGDLDDYGVWRSAPVYGNIWVPRVSVGWAPYRYGHWAWIAPWGWTWVDDAPWGFAPFHYGRWVWWSGAWGWVPGPYYARPFYAPALVAWFGGGGHWGVGFGFGWCPLGFGEPFFPWYHVRRHYFHRVNFANAHINNFNFVTNNYFSRNPNGLRRMQYSNLRVHGAFTAASRDMIAHGRPIGRNGLRVSPGDLRTVRPIQGRLGIDPGRGARLGAGFRPGATPPARATSRPTFTHMTPPAQTGRFGTGQRSTDIRPQARLSSPMARPFNNNNVPRPPSGSFDRRGASPSFTGRSIPRPGADRFGPRSGSVPRPRADVSGPRIAAPRQTGPMNYNRPNRDFGSSRPNYSVPRPSGPVRSAPQYSAPRSPATRNYGQPQYNGGYRGYSAPRSASPSYGRSPRSYNPAPSYRNAPSYRAPSAPSYSAPRGGGGSYHGGGGGGGSRGWSGGGSSGGSHGGGHSGRGR